MRIFPDDGNGSRVLITTRMEKVAIEATPVELMRVMIRPLTDEESWKLFVLKAFKQETCPYELEERARTVSQGLPILILLVAGIFSSTEGGNQSEFESKWRGLMNILSSDNTRVDSVYEEVVDLILSLSYAHLDHRLRSCFLYMGVFPEDYEIKVSKLAKLWIAQVFMEEQSSSSSWPPKSCEEEEECLNELVNRNLVTIQKIKSNGCRIKSCSLHDMFRDFCIKKSHEDGFFQCVKGNFTDAVSRTMVTFDLDSLKRICDSDSNDGTHTIMCFGHGHNRLISLRRFRLLKTLDMVNVELFLFKLLALSHIPELPPSLSKLRYLETLIIHPRGTSSTLMPFPYIVCLPPEIWTMMQLRHLISFCWGILPDPPEGENLSLHNLQTLSAVMNLDCREQQTWLRMFPNIKKLAIFYFGVGRATHSLKRLQSLHRLEKLKVWVLAPFSSPQKLELCYSVTIRKLNLRGIDISSADMNLIGEMPCLQVLKLKQNAFEDDEWRTRFTEFSMLEHLQLEELSLKLWVFNEDFLVLQNLKSLVVRACNRLSEIPMGVADIETLKQIKVVGGKKISYGIGQAHNRKETKILLPSV